VKIHLDYAKPPQSTPSWTWGLLLFALLVVSFAGGEYMQLEDKRTDLESRLRSTGPGRNASAVAPPSPETQKALREHVLQANAVLSELSRPWPMLFLVLEETARPEIALLAIRPDATKGRLRIAGEAREVADALDYIRRLAASGHMTDVVLEEHEVMVTDSQKPVRFVLSARWMG